MSGVCGWAGAAYGAEARALLHGMAAPLARHDGASLAVHLGHDRALASASTGGHGGVCAGDRLAAAVAGHPFFEDEALERTRRERGPAAAFLQGLVQSGEALLARTRGDFAVAWTDGEVLTLATDRCAIRPLFYRHEGDHLVFASSGLALDAHPLGESAVDPQGIYDYVYLGFVPGPGGARVGRSRLEPGELLRFRRGRVELARWWRQEFVEDRPADRTALAGEMRSLLREAVRRRVGEGPVGAFLSGGLDSSTVAGMLAEVAGEARTYSIGFDVPGYDEMRYARIAAQRFGAVHREYYVTPQDVVKAVPLLAGAYPEPFGNESAVPAFYCARLAREDGVRRLLAGDGGDEIFAGNSRYVTQKVFDLYGRVPGLLRALFEPVLFRFPFGDRLPLLRKARSYVRKAKTPLPDRLQDYNLVEMLGAPAVFDPDFLSRVDPGRPLRLLQETWRAARAQSTLNRLLALDWKFTLADCDLPKVCRMCERAGVDVVFPMLDEDLVAFAGRVPPRLLLPGFKLRHFYKEAMRGFLPDAILRKKKHGFGLPFGVWLSSHRPLQVLAEESLEGLRARRIVRQEFLDKVVAAHRGEHAAYYGVMIWTFMMLEQWHRCHVDGAARPMRTGG